MKNNKFYAVPQNKWSIYFYKASWTHFYYGKYGKDDAPANIGYKHIENKKHIELKGDEKWLKNLKEYIIVQLFEYDRVYLK